MIPTLHGTDVPIPLPPPALRLMADDDDRFVSQAVTLAEMLYRHGLRDDQEVLDVGCSVGRLAIGLRSGTTFHGRYVGFDVMQKQVQWARRHLQPALPDSVFRYVDVRNARYNPRGTVDPATLRFPARSRGFHMACLFSIFTHFYKEDIAVYLHELRRVLRPGGTVVATWFLYDDERYDAAVHSTYPMVHRHDEVTIYNDPEDPLRAIAFHEDAVRRMIADAGLEVVEIRHGTWADGPGPDFQDVVVMRKPRPAPQPPVDRSLPARIRRRVRRDASRLVSRLRAR